MTVSVPLALLAALLFALSAALQQRAARSTARRLAAPSPVAAPAALDIPNSPTACAATRIVDIAGNRDPESATYPDGGALDTTAPVPEPASATYRIADATTDTLPDGGARDTTAPTREPGSATYRVAAANTAANTLPDGGATGGALDTTAVARERGRSPRDVQRAREGRLREGPATSATGATDHSRALPAAAGQPTVRVFALLRRLVRDPVWLAGWVANLAGSSTQAVALHLGSIVAVQAVLITQLLFALPFATVQQGRWPLRRDWVGAAAVCAGLATLLVMRGTVPQTTDRRADAWLVVVVAGALIGLLLLAGWTVRAHAQSRTAAVASAAGICFCLTAVFYIYVGDDLAKHGVFGTVLDWPLAGLCCSTLLGMLLVQDAFASGSLPTAMTAMTITDPVASIVAGAVLFDAGPPVRPGVLPWYVVAVGLIALGVGVLANSPTLHDERRTR